MGRIVEIQRAGKDYYPNRGAIVRIRQGSSTARKAPGYVARGSRQTSTLSPTCERERWKVLRRLRVKDERELREEAMDYDKDRLEY